jgi:hypothetical protein
MSTTNKKRDYRAEYQSRIQRGIKRGLTRSQASGHPKAGEKPIRPPQPIEDLSLQISLKALRKGMTLKDAAKEAGLSAERLRNEATSKGLIHKKGNRWQIKPRLTRTMLVFSQAESFNLVISQKRYASIIGRYMSAVGDFLRTNVPEHLKPFIGKSIKDSTSKSYLLETEPNALYRINAGGSETFEQVYRIVV